MNAIVRISALLYHCISGHSDSDEGLASTVHSEYKSVDCQAL